MLLGTKYGWNTTFLTELFITLNIVRDRAISSSLYGQTIPRHEKPGTGGPGWAPCRHDSGRAGSLRDLCWDPGRI